MILAQQLILGVLVGGLYGLAAAGLSLTFGVLRVLNVAHGELLMLGGYGTFWLFALWQFDPFLSLLGVGPALFVLGLVLYWALFQFVVRAHEETRIKNSLLIGFGLTLVFHSLAIRLWTADERAVTTDYAGAVLKVGIFAVPIVRLASLALAFVVLAALHLFLGKARWGRAIRATAEDWEAAALMGIPVGRVYLLAFALGTALAGVAGGLVSVSYSISPSIGLEWTLKALIVVVLAGLGSLFGSFAGGIVLGLAEATSVVFLGGPYREVVGLVLFLAILLVRPQGLFGSRG
ncbi:MAG: branched-chain amino acid ABC transporter permease [Deltaproteobacteria bacterium]|nr:branched-chain amino acid ABC transporter permease [Deltaproteobacteria bacterium]